MKVAVSGASGFIGRHVVAELVRRKETVVAIARDAGRVAPAAGLSVVTLDMVSPPSNSFDHLGRPDVLIHLAWDGLPNYNAVRHLEIELPRQISFLRNLIADGLPALVVAGTCLEYGMRSGALHEALPAKPSVSYAIAKDRLHQELQGLRTTHHFALSWARLFYMYGPGQAAGSLLPQLTVAVERGDARFNMSGGEQLRDYLPVQEVARLLVELALKRCDAGVVNVCSGRPLRVRDLVETWLEEHQWRIALNLGHYPYLEYEPMAFWGERSHLNAVLGSG